MLSRLRASWRMLTRRDGYESDLRDELRQHVEHRTADLVAAGMTPDSARRRALHELGGVEAVKEECREATGLAWLHAFGRDLRHGFRLLRRNPGFAAVAVLTLALCIGANTALYSLVDAALFRPLPYPQPDRLGQVVRRSVQQPGSKPDVSVDGATWARVRDSAPDLHAAAFSDWTTGVNLLADGRASYVQQQKVSAGFFDVLGVAPRIGRGFHDEEDRPGGATVVVLSDALWRDLYASDPRVVGRRVTLRGEPYEVVGVMPAGFRSTVPADLWTPLRPSTSGEGTGTNYAVVARLAPDATWARVDGELAAIGRDLSAAGSFDPNQSLGIEPLQKTHGLDLRRPLLLLWMAVVAVLLIGCLNLASLLLARAAVRGPEMATRMAIGGGRGPLVRQLFAEGVALALCGGGLGLLIGQLTLPVLLRLAAPLGYDLEASIDGRVLAIMALLSLGTTLLFGLYPAWKLSGVSVRTAMGELGERVAGSGARHWPRRLLVVAEVALAVVLLVSATLLARSLAHLRGVDPGFDPDGLVTASVSLQDARYDTADEIARLFRDSLERIATSPGVEAAGVALTAPYERPLNIPFNRAGEAPEQRSLTNMVYVAGDYFRTLGVPVLQGRDLRPTDRGGAPRVALVNRAFVERYLDDAPALGQRLEAGSTEWEIVGVVGDVVQRASFGDFEPLAHTPTVYVPAGQLPDDWVGMVHGWFTPSWTARAAAGGSATTAVADAIREGLHAADPTLPIARLGGVSELMDRSLVAQRFQAWLMGCLAALALVLSGVGLAGLVGSAVAERRRELGVRLALGSSRGRALASAVLPGLGLAAAGLGLGALSAPLAFRLLRGLLWGIGVGDPGTVGVVVTALLVVAGLGSLLPALHVVRLDPAATLRRE
jgi:predicted permease